VYGDFGLEAGRQGGDRGDHRGGEGGIGGRDMRFRTRPTHDFKGHRSGGEGIEASEDGSRASLTQQCSQTVPGGVVGRCEARHDIKWVISERGDR
jgi:hypothetical protein